MANRHLIFLLIFLLPKLSIAQNAVISGKVSTNNTPLAGVNIFIPDIGGTNSDSDGQYRLVFDRAFSGIIYFTHIGFDTVSHFVEIQRGVQHALDVEMKESVRILDQVEINAQKVRDASVISINPRSFNAIPSAFGDFNRVLATLPGVVTANELSSAYSVRGGNYDENLIYVNRMEIYRPFLVRAGRQEGLSFINPNLVKKATFYAGGWQPYYGNKLSSVLDVEYKTPVDFGGSISMGLLGGNAHVEGSSKDKRIQYLAGARHKRSQYLFNTFDVQGEYFPTFTDIQGSIRSNLGKENPEDTQLGVLFSYAKNRYKVIPTTRETEFGTFNNAFRFLVAFEGAEQLDYDTWQTGLNFTRRLNDNLSIQAIVSGIKTYEREYSDLEGGYRLCDLDKNPSSSTFNECVSIRGLGTNYFHARNTLEGNLFGAELSVELGTLSGVIRGGIEYDYQEFNDYIEEYRFVDSADFVTVTDNVLQSNFTAASILGGYVQHEYHFSNFSSITYGLRFAYRDMNDQFILSPRVQFVNQVSWAQNLAIKASAGIYQQYPFYREMRRFDGTVNQDADAQQSVHLILGTEKGMTIWDRPFHFTSEVYYKHLWDVIPYEVDNVRLRYFGDNVATAYAVGFDARFSGEFIRGAESWFSLGVLSTKEKLSDGESDYIRRPTDQRFTLGAFFEDHLPDNPTMRVNLSLVYGSGLPFGPPGNFETRTTFNGTSYNRVDVGFTKIILINQKWDNTIWIGLEVLNLLGAQNTISYTWIQDISNQYIAIPNTLSNRFFNVKLSYRFNSTL